MNTPIYDFLHKYADSDAIRMHMPGHKGVNSVGCEQFDLTEIAGADELFAPTGIIAESEANASKIFGCDTFYATEGSSLCIRAMLCTALQYAAESGRPPLIYAARNVHKTYLTAAALLQFQTKWLPQYSTKNYLSADIDWSNTERMLRQESQKPIAMYLTSPDYLGNLTDIREAAAICRRHHMLLMIDNAHGAYLKFLSASCHPIDLGADLCCDSAHKTLPVLTGGAYLHLADQQKENLCKYAKNAMELFASTSPSYLILASLDRCNAYLCGRYQDALKRTILQLNEIKNALTAHGWTLTGDEPMKLTIRPKTFGYTGTELANILQNHRIYAEFSDSDHLVLMPSAWNHPRELEKVRQVLCQIPDRPEICETPPVFSQPEAVLSPRETLLTPTEILPLSACAGRICAEFSVSCPPAVPIVMAGERISDEAIAAMRYYKIKFCKVVK